MNTIDEMLAGFRADTPAPRPDHAHEVATRTLDEVPSVAGASHGRRSAWLAVTVAIVAAAFLATLVTVFLSSDYRQRPALDGPSGWGLHVNVRIVPLNKGADRADLTRQAASALQERWTAKGLKELRVDVVADGQLRLTVPRASLTAQLAGFTGTRDRRVYDANRALFKSTDPNAVAAWLRRQPVDESRTRWTILPPTDYGAPWFGPLASTVDPADVAIMTSTDSNVARGPSSLRVIALFDQYPHSPERPVRYYVVRDTDALVSGNDIDAPKQDGRDVLVRLSPRASKVINARLTTASNPLLLLADINVGAPIYGPLTLTTDSRVYRIVRPGISSTPVGGQVSAEFIVTDARRYGKVPALEGPVAKSPPAAIDAAEIVRVGKALGVPGSIDGPIHRTLSFTVDGVRWTLFAARSKSSFDVAWLVGGAGPATFSWCNPGVGIAHTVTCLRASVDSPTHSAVVFGRTGPGVASAILVGRDGSRTAATVANGWWAAVGKSRSLGDWRQLITRDKAGSTLELLPLDGQSDTP